LFASPKENKFWGAKFRQSDVKKRSNIGEINSEENQKKRLADQKPWCWNLPELTTQAIFVTEQRYSLLSSEARVVYDLEYPVTDVTFVPMQQSI